jgi:hypothetical protein
VENVVEHCRDHGGVDKILGRVRQGNFNNLKLYPLFLELPLNHGVASPEAENNSL